MGLQQRQPAFFFFSFLLQLLSIGEGWRLKPGLELWSAYIMHDLRFFFFFFFFKGGKRLVNFS